jgi:hypothetical protein
MHKIEKQIWKNEPVYKLDKTILDHVTHKEVHVRFPDDMEMTTPLLWKEVRVPYHIYWTPYIKIVYHGLTVYLDFENEMVRENLFVRAM